MDCSSNNNIKGVRPKLRRGAFSNKHSKYNESIKKKAKKLLLKIE